MSSSSSPPQNPAKQQPFSKDRGGSWRGRARGRGSKFGESASAGRGRAAGGAKQDDSHGDGQSFENGIKPGGLTSASTDTAASSTPLIQHTEKRSSRVLANHIDIDAPSITAATMPTSPCIEQFCNGTSTVPLLTDPGDLALSRTTNEPLVEPPASVTEESALKYSMTTAIKHAPGHNVTSTAVEGTFASLSSCYSSLPSTMSEMLVDQVYWVQSGEFPQIKTPAGAATGHSLSSCGLQTKGTAEVLPLSDTGYSLTLAVSPNTGRVITNKHIPVPLEEESKTEVSPASKQFCPKAARMPSIPHSQQIFSIGSPLTAQPTEPASMGPAINTTLSQLWPQFDTTMDCGASSGMETIQNSLSSPYQSTPVSSEPPYSDMPPLEKTPEKVPITHEADNITEVANKHNSTTLLFSCLPTMMKQSHLEGYCRFLGEEVFLESLDILENGEARATVSGLTTKEISDIETETHSIKGKEFSVKVDTSDNLSVGALTGKECTLEVSDLTEEISEEFLEIYFEKPKSGGGKDCLEEIKIVQPGVAHVTFNTPEVAARVLAKEGHKILGHVVKLKYIAKTATQMPKEYEANKLLLRDIPAGVDEEHFQLYLSTQLKTEEFSIERVGKDAVITFTNEYQLKELEKMVSNIQAKQLKKAKVAAELYKVCSSIRLSNVTKNYSEEFVKLYFESMKSGGGANKVRSVEFLGNGEAVVAFESPQDAEQVLKQSHSGSFGETVRVELNDELCVAKQQLLKATHALLQDSKTSSKATAGSLKAPKLNTKLVIPVKPLIALSINKASHNFKERMEQLQIEIDIDTKTGTISVSQTKLTPAGWQRRAKVDIESYIKENVTLEENTIIPKDGFTDILGQFSNIQVEFPTFVWKFKANNTKVSFAGAPTNVDHIKGVLKEISDNHTVTTESIPLSPEEFTFITELKLQLMKTSFPNLTAIDPQREKKSLTITGTVKDVRNFRQAIPEFKSHAVVVLTPKQQFFSFLQFRGRQRLLDFVKSYPFAVHFNPTQSIVSLLCEPNQTKTAHLAVEQLQQTLSIEKHSLPKSFVSMLPQLEDFPALCQEFEIQNAVSISTNTVEAELVVVGFKQDVKQCMTPLCQYVKEKCTVEMPIPLEAGIWRLLQTHMREEWQSLMKKCKQLEVSYLQPSWEEEDSFTLTLKGDKLSVEQISDALSGLLAKICKRNIEKNQPGTCKFFRSRKARTILYGIEAQMRVVIEVTEADEETGILGDTPSSKFEKKCTATLPQGSIKISIFIGDITEFRTDVIVNAANEDLKHIGGVAQAIATKGGPVIQSDSDNHVRRSGKVCTGDVWLTENTGNLPCKALVHAVGPRWSGGKSKEEALLRKVCLRSIRSCDNKYCSIAFPAISSGVYGFPIDKCADTMITAFIDYSKQHLSSNLQEISLVLFKQGDSSVFISALKKHLPNIHMTKPASYTPQPQLSFSTIEVPSTLRGRKKKTSTMVLASGSAPIKLHRGGLLDIQADVYVNSTNPNLDLSQGAVANTLLAAGGQQLQTECTTKAPLHKGEVAVTGFGRIQSKRIVHTVVPNFDRRGGKAEKVLRKSIHSCLKACTKLQVKSVAFPSIGAGNLCFPNDVTAEVMVSEINSFFATNPSTSLSTVHLVIFMADTYQAFQTAIQNSQRVPAAPVTFSTAEQTDTLRSPAKLAHTPRRVKHHTQQVTARGTSSATLNFDQLQVCITQGNITEELTDIIVVPTNSTMQLQGRGVAGAILKKGGPQLQTLCDAIFVNYQPKLPEGKIAVTPVAGSLKSKMLFHIVFESKDNKKFVKLIIACLQEAEKLNYQSISFPAIGTGIYGYPDESAALGMYKAMEKCSKLKHLKQVRIVLFSQDVCCTFIKVFKNPSAFEIPGLWDRMVSLIPSFNGSSSSAGSEISVVESTVDITPSQEIVIRVYGETKASVDAAEVEIEKLIEDTFITAEFENKFVNSLSQEDLIRLTRRAKELDVHYDIDRAPLNLIKIKGNDTSVHKMQCFAVELLAEVERAIKKKEDAEKMHKTVKWSRTDSNGDEEEYLIEENYEIENAWRFRGGKGTFRYTCPSDPDHTDFTLDFDKNEEIDHTKLDTICKISRVDLLKKAQEETPKEWDKIPIDPSSGNAIIVHSVDLDPRTQEYQSVKQQFDTSMQCNAVMQHPHAHLGLSIQQSLSSRNHYNSIIKIQRIQNPTLYSQYVARKKKMDEANPRSCQNERKLFHGTKPDTCPKINYGGFNRSYCGQNATVYGKGVYFARDAEYSARDQYSPRDANGYKYVYLARVLTGEFTQGGGGMLVPPPKNPSMNANILYDSVVDNVASPGIFVVFQDAQNYPEYLIVFN